MDTKWKNRGGIAIWLILLTFGISGVLSFVNMGGNYLQPGYFNTPEFQSRLDQFNSYVSMFELNDITVQKAKESITVSEAEIEEHRYRYGDLNAQISNIKSQYEAQIEEATTAGNEEAAAAYRKERDKKIDDITKNFESDEYVEQKVRKEKEKELEQYFTDRKAIHSEFERLKGSFDFYLKNTETGTVFTNIKLPEGTSAEEYFDEKNMLFSKHYAEFPYVPSYELSFPGSEELLNQQSGESFAGYVGIPESASSANQIISDYNNYKRGKIVFFVYMIASIASLVLVIYGLKKRKVEFSEVEGWRPYYNRLPIDVRGALFIIVGFGALLSLSFVSNFRYLSFDRMYYNAVGDLVAGLVFAALLVGLTLLQGKFLLEVLKDRSLFKEQWKKALFHKGWQGLQDAFLNRRTGTQFFLLLTVVFGLGFAAVVIGAEPAFLVVYVPVVAIVGIPLMIILIRAIGYFNRIVMKTDELAAGTLGPDLPIRGKSVLANLAENINDLKQGVKLSQKQQAKSERLKTELITNVSHDLRTPLTSIITYTELLKKTDLVNEERDAYLEIIDRKSKRLKLLIEDLFEVSKMTSGNIELVKEKVDLNQLLQQALAEHENTISDSSLAFKVTSPDQPIYAVVDGQKLWRVFDNLIGNILKYSLEKSRVYLSVKELDDEAVITFKNVSKYELSDNIDELFERFKRGDTSRHTDGSGLGLAIAKSIVDLHDGSMDIDVDGDLFKVTLRLKTIKN
ncbi:histidine kinase dimerization/phospho-acceptor domain-containing protein [Pseudalkalibacillus caeni]|uniref:histidine kinase n=1 Tax=Exobacillus caeni TaxID=2574798 RepID=A0A5R9F3L7_9BACL|nr:histidine kinase dimerization/phospho-acceptor domain-containing protein [Pseudalkalibacillus caeni]TLS37089.1 HAMP domain-containing histidine kinase [Pseudalkalibacillus caeni]